MTNEERYEQKWKTPSDANEHLPFLRECAAKCQTVVECGTWLSVTATGLLMGLLDSSQTNKRFTIVDMNSDYLAWTKKRLEEFDLGRNPPQIDYVLGSTLEIDLPESDLLFIDTYHSFSCLSQELARHHDKARKYIIGHDWISFAILGEDGNCPGIQEAVEQFLDTNPEWQLTRTFDHNNGLFVLGRV